MFPTHVVTLWITLGGCFCFAKQEFRVNFYFRQSWTDPRLSFSTTDGKTDGHRGILFPEMSWKHIWVPDTFMKSARDEKADTDMSPTRLVRVKPNGEVWYVIK